MSLFFLSGPHGAGKTTLSARLQEHCGDVLIPKLETIIPRFRTSPLERIALKVCERAIENYEALGIAEKNKEKIVLANRCVYDAEAYAEVYARLGWVNTAEYNQLLDLNGFAFPVRVREPLAIVLNPPFEVTWERLRRRWLTEEKKWNEENEDYLKAACKAYEKFEGKSNVLYLRGSEKVEEISRWLKEKQNEYSTKKVSC